MKIKHTAKEILEELKPLHGVTHDVIHCKVCQAYINQALKDLDSLVPKKKDSKDYYGTTIHTKGRNDGFNEAIDEMHKIYRI